MRLNPDVHVKRPSIYNWFMSPVDCIYYSDYVEYLNDKSLKIFVEREIVCDVVWKYCYELVRKKVQCGDEYFALIAHKDNCCDADIAGIEKNEVVFFVVERIIKDTMFGSDWEEKHPNEKKYHNVQKNTLRKILKKMIGDFISI